MQKYEMEIEFNRLDAVMPRKDQENALKITALFAELERKYMNLSRHIWRDAVSWVIDHQKVRSVPTIKDFDEALSAVKPKIHEESVRRVTPHDHEQWMLAQVQGLSRDYSVQMIEMHEAGRVTWPQPVLNELLQRSINGHAAVNCCAKCEERAGINRPKTAAIEPALIVPAAPASPDEEVPF